MAVEGAVALGIARDVVEQQRRRGAVAVFGQHVRDGAHLGVPMGARDALQLAHSLDLIDPAAQAAIPALHQLQACFTRLRHATLHTVPKLEIGFDFGTETILNRKRKCNRGRAQITATRKSKCRDFFEMRRAAETWSVARCRGWKTRSCYGARDALPTISVLTASFICGWCAPSTRMAASPQSTPARRVRCPACSRCGPVKISKACRRSIFVTPQRKR